ncbi:MAG: cytochrome P450 [Microthrixaceae bacterium]
MATQPASNASPGEPPAAAANLTEMEADLLLGTAVMTDEGRQDPYVHYRRLREELGRYRSGLGSIVVADYESCLEVLRNPALGRPEPDMDVPPGMSGRERRTEQRQGSMLFANPPDHTRLRSLVSRAFTPRRTEAMRPRIAELLAPLLDEMAQQGGVDVLDALGARLPAAVISDLLGVPPELHEELAPHVRASTALIDAAADDAAIEAAEAGVAVMGEVFEQLIADKRAHPDDGLLSALIAVEEQGDRLSHEELLANTGLMYAAGFETTTNLIGNGLYALLTNPEQLARLRNDRSLLGSAIWELLRWDSPVQLNMRAALTELELFGEPVGYGQLFTVLQGSANRDEKVYSAADTLDVGRFVDRTTPPPLSFGWGPHHCLGASLARAEGEIVFGGLLDRFRSIELLEQPTFRPSFTLRGLNSLRVACRTA